MAGLWKPKLMKQIPYYPNAYLYRVTCWKINIRQKIIIYPVSSLMSSLCRTGSEQKVQAEDSNDLCTGFCSTISSSFESWLYL